MKYAEYELPRCYSIDKFQKSYKYNNEKEFASTIKEYADFVWGPKEECFENRHKKKERSFISKRCVSETCNCEAHYLELFHNFSGDDLVFERVCYGCGKRWFYIKRSPLLEKMEKKEKLKVDTYTVNGNMLVHNNGAKAFEYKISKSGELENCFETGMESISDYFGEIIVSIVGVALLISSITLFNTEISEFFTCIVDTLTSAFGG